MELNATAALVDRFWVKVLQGGPDECWEWTAGRQTHGYGVFVADGRMRLAHRVAWFLEHGADAGALCVLHRCDNPSCVNPAHLSLGTHTDNMRDAVVKRRNAESRKTHCPQGHEYTPENTYVYPRGAGTHRICRTCTHHRNAERIRGRRADDQENVT